MKIAAVLAVATLALGTMLWAADDAAIERQEATSLKLQAPGLGTEAIAIPQVLSYQGRLTDETGVPVPNGDYRVTFNLYATPEDGSPFWNETQSVTTRDGMFSVLLGSVTPINAVTGVSAAYLGMAVQGDAEMSPRLRIAGTASTAGLAAGSSPRGGTDADDAWVRIGSDSVLYTIRRLGLVRGGSSNVLYGIYGYTQTIFGSSCTTGASGSNVGNIAIGGGYGNRAWAPFTAVCGGRNNKAGDAATDTSAIVVGGYGNKATDKFSAVIGGQNNIASGLYATIAGGLSDTAKAPYGGVLAGYSNLAGDAVADTAACVAGGYNNTATGKLAFVGGGRGNTASDECATAGGGLNNSASNFAATVAGGSHNSAVGPHTTIGGGASNTASGDYATAVGGVYSYASGNIATVGGGYSNNATYNYATVAGGDSNTASGWAATVAGGEYNSATYDYTTVGGGEDNIASGYDATVAGGEGNSATGDYATVAGGAANSADGDYSFVAGDASEVPADYDGSAAFNGEVADDDYEVRCDVLSSNSMVFELDDPLDPDGTIMNQFAVGSPEIVVTFRGSAVIGTGGRVVAELPRYFDALCRNPMVQLTGVGTYEVYVADKVIGNRFVIGGKPGTEVYWTVTGERKDQIAEITRLRMPVQEPRTGALVGRSISDASLVGSLPELQRLGLDGKYSFRTAAGKKRYEDMLKRKSEAKQRKSARPVQPRVEPKQLQPQAQPQKLQQQ